MSLDDIDPESWLKKEPIVSPSPVQLDPIVPLPSEAGDDRETRVSRSRHKTRKAVTSFLLKEKILESTLNMGGRLTLQKILQRNKSDDVSIPAFILEIVQQKEEGYDA